MQLTGTDVAALFSALLLGLSAGLFFAFSIAVMPGLRAVNDAGFVATMNAINRAILNPVFGIVFVGALIAPAVAAVLAYVAGDSLRGTLFSAAAVIYLLGVLVVTGAVNVPLNDALARDNNRAAFEERWVRFTRVRTVAGVLAFAAALLGLML